VCAGPRRIPSTSTVIFRVHHAFLLTSPRGLSHELPTSSPPRILCIRPTSPSSTSRRPVGACVYGLHFFCVIIAHSCALARALLRTHARTLALAHALWQTRARSCAHARALARQSRAALATERLPKSNPGCSETKTCKLLTVPSQIADCSVSKRGVFHCADFLVSLKVPYK
jgi:hypothetical protein